MRHGRVAANRNVFGHSEYEMSQKVTEHHFSTKKTGIIPNYLDH